ncbi:MAG TPA: murein biosynthesis integral membrane protein MurJ [Pyrinomonadaceae bacterium]|nr:murein biosynthesis integral membrane protein MurJ [Pyrinomonadaceae bacterium]
MKDSSNGDSTNLPEDSESVSEVQDNQSVSTSEKTLVANVETPRVRSDAGVIAGESVEPVAAVTGEFPSAKSGKGFEASSGKSAVAVGAGILISRIIGLLRQRVFAHYFGTSAAGDAFSAAFRIPNFLQNTFGEGALSASFIPVYAKLLAKGDEKEASHVASAVLGLLALVTSLIVLGGILSSPYLIDFIAPGFEGERRELTIRLVRILFPGAGVLVLSAWCLGILNSHHRFFISYTAPVAWNLAIISSLLFFGGTVGQFQLAEVAAWGALVGSALQFFVQLPTVFKLVHSLLPVIDLASVHVKTVLKNFFPVFMSRGVIQISAFVDEIIASYLPVGAVIGLNYAQSLYTLPVSLFGMSVSAAELPAMSRAVGTSDQVAEVLRSRLDAGLRRIAFFIVPSATAFLLFGDVIAAVLYQTGQFQRDAAVYVWGILAGSSIGLLAATLGRLYSSTYYALHDTRTPLLYAIIHVALTTILGYVCAILLPPAIGIEPKWGVVGLTASASVAAWVEFVLLRRSLNSRIGRTGLPLAYLTKLWLAALVGGAVGWGFKLFLGPLHPVPFAAVVLISYGITYFGLTYALGIAESAVVVGRVLRFLKLTR